MGENSRSNSSAAETKKVEFEHTKTGILKKIKSQINSLSPIESMVDL